MNEGQEYDIELVKTGKDVNEPFEPSDQTFDFIALTDRIPRVIAGWIWAERPGYIPELSQIGEFGHPRRRGPSADKWAC